MKLIIISLVFFVLMMAVIWPFYFSMQNKSGELYSPDLNWFEKLVNLHSKLLTIFSGVPLAIATWKKSWNFWRKLIKKLCRRIHTNA